MALVRVTAALVLTEEKQALYNTANAGNRAEQSTLPPTSIQHSHAFISACIFLSNVAGCRRRAGNSNTDWLVGEANIRSADLIISAASR